MTAYETEQARYSRIIRETLQSLKNEGFRVFAPKNPSSWGYVYDSQRNAIISVSCSELGLALSFTTRPNKTCGTGYHCLGHVLPGDGMDFLASVTGKEIEESIQRGQRMLACSVSPQNCLMYLYKNIDEFIEHERWCELEEL